MILRKLKQWVGIPAPAKLKHDDWFPVPEELKEPEPVVFEEDVKLDPITGVRLSPPSQHKVIEDECMHDWVYQEATKNSSTTLDLNPPGGSDTIWESGVG